MNGGVGVKRVRRVRLGIARHEWVSGPVSMYSSLYVTERKGMVFFFLHTSTVIRSRDKVRQREPFLSRAGSHNSVESELQRLHVPSFNADVLPLVRAHLLKTSSDLLLSPTYLHVDLDPSEGWLSPITADTRLLCPPRPFPEPRFIKVHHVSSRNSVENVVLDRPDYPGISRVGYM